MFVAEGSGEFLARVQEIEQDLLVHRIGAGVVSEEHVAAQVGAFRVGHDGHVIRIVGSEMDDAGIIGSTGGGLVLGDVVGGQTGELIGIADGDGLDVLLHILAEGEAELGNAVLQLLDARSGSIVLIDAGEAVFEQSALQVMASSRVSVGGVDGDQGVIDRLVE